MSISLNDRAYGEVDCSEELAIVFVGKELFYSNQTLRSVQSEFGVAASRFDSLDDLLAHGKATSATARVIVVDQMLIEDLLARPKDYMTIASSGCLALAYRKESSARILFEHWNRAKYGDIGYLPMNVAPDVWRAILRLLMHEELHLPSFLADCLPSAPMQGQAAAATQSPSPVASDKLPLFSKLTRREKQVLRLVSQGKSNKTIASNLGITEHTVKLHMHNMSGKIGVNNRTAAAHFYFEVAPDQVRKSAT